MTLSVERFAEFYASLHPGRQAFPWQIRLCRMVMTEGWPRGLYLPTASGKSACIAIAVYTLAAGVAHAPRRIVHVVDRRVGLDHTYRHASDIASRLREAQSGILREVADGLRARRGLDPAADDEPLACFSLRAGTYRNNAWARTPSQPTVVCSSVDQIGSRLLFRGYGVGDYLQSLHAGLVANDALLLLDDVHGAKPLLQTLDAIARYRANFGSVARFTPFAYTSLSATPLSETLIGRKHLFLLDGDDGRDAVLAPRLCASKPTRLVAVGARSTTTTFAERVVEQARVLADAGAKRIAIVVNRVRSAQLVFDHLAEVPESRKRLITGTMRPLDRDASLRSGVSMLSGDGLHASLSEPIFLVTTQCIEVDADIDVDGLVTECASLDALRQRFGRLYRSGKRVEGSDPARLAAIIVGSADGIKGGDAVYGDATRGCWEWLMALRSDADLIDFATSVMAARLHDGAPAQTMIRFEDAPVLLPTYLDQWVQTSPRPHHEPEPALFLHGTACDSPAIHLCWRADLDPANSQSWVETVALLPPSVGECATLPLSDFRLTMHGQNPPGAGDVEGLSATEHRDDLDHLPFPEVCLVWRGDHSFTTRDANALRAGDTIVLAMGGRSDRLGVFAAWNIAAVDQAEQAMLEARGRLCMRVHRTRVGDCSNAESRRALNALLDRQFTVAEPDPEPPEVLVAVGEALKPYAAESPSDWRAIAASCLATAAGRQRFRVKIHPDGGWVIERRQAFSAATMRRLGFSAPASDFTSEDDSASFTVNVPLITHLAGVAEFAQAYTRACGLPAELAADVRTAASLHDLGKLDSRFQSMLRAGTPVWLENNLQNASAKSNGAQDLRARSLAHERSGYPNGARHELLAVRLAESDAVAAAKSHDFDLVLHLIASHHGRCRPFAPVVFDDVGCDLRVHYEGRSMRHTGPTGAERIDSGISERFWRLNRRYGWWGLAYLEAILRLADHRRSEFEEREAQKSIKESGDGE
jgi:CRISPR-associated endonuclease/helicase Cas3